jgi:hypothetical protein
VTITVFAIPACCDWIGCEQRPTFVLVVSEYAAARFVCAEHERDHMLGARLVDGKRNDNDNDNDNDKRN